MNIDEIKCAFIIPRYETRLFDRNVKYEELISWGDEAYVKVRNCQILFIGLLLALKADYITDITGEEHKYDLIMTLHPMLERKFREDQLSFYIESEPPGNSAELGRPWDSLNTPIKGPYDYLLNNYILKSNNPRNFPWHFCYDLGFFQRIESTKIKNKIFLQKRSTKGKRSDSPLVLPDRYITSVEQSGYVPFNKTSLPTYVHYCKELKSCEYMISNCWTDSPGQVTVESVLLDVIPFAPEHKLFTQLLLPKFCWFTTLEEVLSKIDLLESDPALKADIQSQLRENIKKVDYNLFRKDIVDLYEKFVNNNKKV